MATILFAGGGTGGHLYPAIAVAEEILQQEPTARIIFAGTKAKIEARVVPQKGFEFHTIWISGFSRRFTVNNLLFPIKVVVSLVQSFFLIKRIRPDVVVGTGGYVCGPVLFTATLLGIPTIVHESNSYPGVTTRLLASRVTNVFITFDVTRKYLSPSSSITLVGNPTRAELSAVSHQEGCRFFGIDPSKRTLFVFGGSLGAASINKAMPEIVKDAVANDYQVIWQTGEADWNSAAAVQQHENIRVMKYVDRMDCGYAAADLVVSRSGATTLAELTRLGKPAVLVPYPYAAANHQELNARAMVESGAAVMINDADISRSLLPAVRELLSDDQKKNTMAEQSRRLGKPNAGKEIASAVLSLRKQQ